MKTLTLCMLIAIAILSLTLAGCGAVAAAVPAASGASATEPTAVPVILSTVNFENISFRYDPTLVKGVKPLAVPGMTEPYVPFDAYRFDFNGYVVNSPVQPTVWVFSSNLPQDNLYEKGISTLRRYLQQQADPGKTLPVYLSGPSANDLDLPMFVPVNARPVLSTQWSAVQGAGANGMRFVTTYAQGPNPLDPHTLVYAYSGLTPDASVAFTAVFPVRPAASLNLPATDIKALFEDLSKLEAYNKQAAEKVAQLGPSDFVPDLRTIDQVMASLTVKGSLPVMTAKSVNRIVFERCTRDAVAFTSEVNTVDGYCFLFPSRFVLKEMDNGVISVTGPALDKSPDPLQVTLQVQAMPTGGQTLDQLAEAFLKENSAPTLKTQRTNLVLDGAPAVMLEPLAGRPTYSAVLRVHGDKLIVLRFSPDAAGFPKAAPDLTELYETVIKSFTFLPL